MTAQFILTQHNQYAIVMVVVLARAETPLRLNALQRHMQVSRPYLFYMLKELCEAGLLKKDERWRAAYRLGRPAEEIRLKQITEAVDSSLYAENSKSRKTLSGEFYELLLWKSFCREKLGECSVADVLAMMRPSQASGP